jgi:parvulin-like peptidyl-prolyl isomerase
MPTPSRHLEMCSPNAAAIAAWAVLIVLLPGTANLYAQLGPPAPVNGIAPTDGLPAIAPGVRMNESGPRAPAFVPTQPATFGVGGTGPASSPVSPDTAAPRFAGEVPSQGQVPQPSVAPEQLTSLEGSTIIARVGGEVVLASEVLPSVYERLAKNADKIPKGKEAEVMRVVVAGALERVVSRKVLYVSALQQVPKENLDKVDAQLSKAFENTLDEKLAGKKSGSQLGELIDGADVSTRPELETYLIAKGSYLAQEERAFKERNLASYAMQGQIEEPGEVTRQQMLAYYREHIVNYQFPAKARWEQLSVRFSRIPDRFAAGEAIRAMGNRVALGGEPFERVAKESSHGSTASDGGRHDWTGRGSLRSDVLNVAIFNQRVGQLGPILEDEDGFHIVRVTQRTEAGVTPFGDEQEAIAEKIVKERQDGQYEAAFERLKSKIPVWTVFDDETTAKQFIAVAADPLRR